MASLRKNSYFKTATPEALMKMHVALKRALGEMKKEKAELEKRVREAETKMLRFESERDEAVAKAAQVLAHTKRISSDFRALDRLVESQPVKNWQEKLTVFLALVRDGPDRDTTLLNWRRFLEPWVAWLTLYGGAPTTQRLREFLQERRKK